ncbi:hypothetical protein GCM10010360_10410 [Streptomyces nogalater]
MRARAKGGWYGKYGSTAVKRVGRRSPTPLRVLGPEETRDCEAPAAPPRDRGPPRPPRYRSACPASGSPPGPVSPPALAPPRPRRPPPQEADLPAHPIEIPLAPSRSRSPYPDEVP